MNFLIKYVDISNLDAGTSRAVIEGVRSANEARALFHKMAIEAGMKTPYIIREEAIDIGIRVSLDMEETSPGVQIKELLAELGEEPGHEDDWTEEDDEMHMDLVNFIVDVAMVAQSPLMESILARDPDLLAFMVDEHLRGVSVLDDSVVTEAILEEGFVGALALSIAKDIEEEGGIGSLLAVVMTLIDTMYD